MKKFYIFLLSAIISSVYTGDICVESVTQHNCEFYSKCLEPKFECGNTGYPIGYGFKYCSKFLINQDLFPKKGQEWIDKTLLCLKEALVPFTTKTKDSNICKNIYNAAFDSHPNCYVKSGFCDLFFQSDVADTIKALLKVYEVKDFRSLISIKQIFETATLCGVDFLKKIWEIITQNNAHPDINNPFLGERMEFLN